MAYDRGHIVYTTEFAQVIQLLSGEHDTPQVEHNT